MLLAILTALADILWVDILIAVGEVEVGVLWIQNHMKCLSVSFFVLTLTLFLSPTHTHIYGEQEKEREAELHAKGLMPILSTFCGRAWIF